MARHPMQIHLGGKMPPTEVLILAMTKMLSGVCTAGFVNQPDPVTGLRWVRPVRDFGTLVPSDMTDANGQMMLCGDVVKLDLISPRPDPPHTEDWLTDFVHHRPQRVRRLGGKKRERLFKKYLDTCPQDILVHHTRSLCLVQPERVQAQFSLDTYSGKYEARMRFVLPQCPKHTQAKSQRGIPVTDIKWRALGRTWLPSKGGQISLDTDTLLERLHANKIFLALGLSRSWQDKYWLLVVGVHTIPDYEVAINVNCL
jgi:hypothetical protein